jgi:hypothetical protein
MATRAKAGPRSRSAHGDSAKGASPRSVPPSKITLYINNLCGHFDSPGRTLQIKAIQTFSLRVRQLFTQLSHHTPARFTRPLQKETRDSNQRRCQENRSLGPRYKSSKPMSYVRWLGSFGPAAGKLDLHIGKPKEVETGLSGIKNFVRSVRPLSDCFADYHGLSLTR